MINNHPAFTRDSRYDQTFFARIVKELKTWAFALHSLSFIIR